MRFLDISKKNTKRKTRIKSCVERQLVIAKKPARKQTVKISSLGSVFLFTLLNSKFTFQSVNMGFRNSKFTLKTVNIEQ